MDLGCGRTASAEQQGRQDRRSGEIALEGVGARVEARTGWAYRVPPPRWRGTPGPGHRSRPAYRERIRRGRGVGLGRDGAERERDRRAAGPRRGVAAAMGGAAYRRRRVRGGMSGAVWGVGAGPGGWGRRRNTGLLTLPQRGAGLGDGAARAGRDVRMVAGDSPSLN